MTNKSHVRPQNKRIHIILNPAAGIDEPILSYINRIFGEANIEWDISITKKLGDGILLTKEALKHRYDIIAAYGGDGTVAEVAEALCGTQTPMVIIPGGTANILAKELGVSASSQNTLMMIAKSTYVIKEMDMGISNGRNFILRITIGDLARMTKKASSTLKNTVGQMAYGISAIQNVGKTEPFLFHIKLDGKEINEMGTSLMVTNAGNFGYEGMSMYPSISVFDGLLDVLLLKKTDIQSLTTIAGNVLFQKKSKGLIRHWKAKKIDVTISRSQPTVHDDTVIGTSSIHVSVMPKAVKVLVPKN